MRFPYSTGYQTVYLVSASGSNYIGTLETVEKVGHMLLVYISMPESLTTSPIATTLKLGGNGHLEFSGEY